MTEKPIIFTKSTKSAARMQTDLVLPDPDEAEPLIVKRYREEASRLYKTLPLPSGKEEEWRRTSLQGIDFSGFKTSKDPHSDAMTLPYDLMCLSLEKKMAGRFSSLR